MTTYQLYMKNAYTIVPTLCIITKSLHKLNTHKPYLFQYSTVEPRLADTPEMRTSTVMWTLRAVPNVSSVYETTPEIRTPLLSGHSE